MKIDVQALKNTPAYRMKAFALPCLLFDWYKDKTWRWVALILLFGYWDIGIRFYFNLKSPNDNT